MHISCANLQGCVCFFKSMQNALRYPINVSTAVYFFCSFVMCFLFGPPHLLHCVTKCSRLMQKSWCSYSAYHCNWCQSGFEVADRLKIPTLFCFFIIRSSKLCFKPILIHRLQWFLPQFKVQFLMAIFVTLSRQKRWKDCINNTINSACF